MILVFADQNETINSNCGNKYATLIFPTLGFPTNMTKMQGINNTKIKIAQSVDKGHISIRILSCRHLQRTKNDLHNGHL